MFRIAAIAGTFILTAGLAGVPAISALADEQGGNWASQQAYDDRDDRGQGAHNSNSDSTGYCHQGFYNVEHCSNSRDNLRYGPYQRDFAFEQGLHILR